uniref:Ovule protein n=1 Tax=Anisakis simplex TaxID=6269 RepID=A0A0M3KFI1_ANISI
LVAKSSTHILRRSDISWYTENADPFPSSVNIKELFKFGRTFLNSTIMSTMSEASSPFQMQLPEDSTTRVENQSSVKLDSMCGSRASLRSMKRSKLLYEQRAVCPFSHVENRDEKVG